MDKEAYEGYTKGWYMYYKSETVQPLEKKIR